MQQLIERTLALIKEQLAVSERPCITWSAGKDSQVMLWLVHSVKPDIEVLYFPGLPHPTKHKFALEIIRQYSLNIRFPLARERDVIAKGDHVEVVELFELAPNRFMYFPIEAEQGYVPDQAACCGVEKLNQMQQGAMHYDAVFIGHRNDDVDPTYGAVPLVDYVTDCGDFRYIYPLRDWTESDIWEVSRSYNIPQNQARYNGDLAANNDYYPLCTHCLSVEAETATCPKTGGQVSAGIGLSALNARREQWGGVFVNIARSNK